MTDKNVVLIVDDIADNLQILASILKDEYHVKVATSGMRCLELVRNGTLPDLILLDVIMPGMDGYEVIKQLKGDVATATIPVIFITSKDEEQEEELGLQLGAVDYITKPISPIIVKARVNTHITLKRQKDQLKALAMCDQLTGLYNRHYLMETAYQKVARAIRHQQPLSLLLLDIDHFKAINDEYGHCMGDKALQKIATALLEACRQEDIIARLGGEEFIVLLDTCHIDEAQEKAESIRQAVERLAVAQISITTSIGVATLNLAGESFDSLLKRADNAMYQAKHLGRNQVILIHQ